MNIIQLILQTVHNHQGLKKKRNNVNMGIKLSEVHHIWQSHFIKEGISSNRCF